MSDIFGIRNQFYLGNFQQVITDASAFNPRGDAAAKIECEIIQYRAFIAMGNHFLVKISDDAPVSLQAVKVLAQYMQSQDVQTASARLSELMVEGGNDPTVVVIAAMIFNREGQYEDALKYLGQNPTALEPMAVLVQTYLKMDRVDLAEKTFKTMQQNEDDATLTQLASAWVNLAKGGNQIQEALFILTDLAEKYNQTVTLLNGMAACHMSKGEFRDAEVLLKEALSKNPNDVDSLINLVVCLQHLRTSDELADSTMSQVRTLNPGHPWVKKISELEDSFDRLAGS